MLVIQYPTSRIVSQSSHEKAIFSTTDLVRAYHKIPVATEDVPKTAVKTRLGYYISSTFNIRKAAQTF